MDRKVTSGTLHKEMCPECGAHLFKQDGEGTVLIMCYNHKKAGSYGMKGTGKCNYKFIQSKQSFYHGG